MRHAAKGCLPVSDGRGLTGGAPQGWRLPERASAHSVDFRNELDRAAAAAAALPDECSWERIRCGSRRWSGTPWLHFPQVDLHGRGCR